MPKNDCPLQMVMEVLCVYEENLKGFACSTDLQYAYIPSLPTQQFSFAYGKFSLQQMFFWAKDLGLQHGKGLDCGSL